MRRIAFAMLAATALLAISPSAASAQMTMGTFQGYFTGHVGMIAGDALTNEKLEVGASVAVQEERGWGAEIDFGHTSDATAGKQILDVTSYLVNAAWVKPGGLVRPFFVAGGGVLGVKGASTTGGAGGFVATSELGIVGCDPLAPGWLCSTKAFKTASEIPKSCK